MQLLSDGQEGVELVRGDVDLAEIHEAQNGLEVGYTEAVEVEERVLVLVSPQNLPEERRAGREDDLVSRDLLLRVAGQSHVEEIRVIFQLPECSADVLLEVIPLQ